MGNPYVTLLAAKSVSLGFPWHSSIRVLSKHDCGLRNYPSCLCLGEDGLVHLLKPVICYYCLVTGQLGGKGALKAATGTQAPGNQQLGSTSARVKLSPHSCPKLVLFKVSLHHSSRHPLQNIQNHGRLNPERRREPPCPPPCVTSEGLMGQNSFPRLSTEDRLQVRNLDRLSVPGVLSHLGHISIQPTLNFSLIVCQLRC